MPASIVCPIHCVKWYKVKKTVATRDLERVLYEQVRSRSLSLGTDSPSAITACRLTRLYGGERISCRPFH